MKTKLYYAGAWGKESYHGQSFTIRRWQLSSEIYTALQYVILNALMFCCGFGSGLPLVVVCVLASKYEMYDKHPQ